MFPWCSITESFRRKMERGEEEEEGGVDEEGKSDRKKE